MFSLLDPNLISPNSPVVLLHAMFHWPQTELLQLPGYWCLADNSPSLPLIVCHGQWQHHLTDLSFHGTWQVLLVHGVSFRGVDLVRPLWRWLKHASIFPLPWFAPSPFPPLKESLRCGQIGRRWLVDPHSVACLPFCEASPSLVGGIVPLCFLIRWHTLLSWINLANCHGNHGVKLLEIWLKRQFNTFTQELKKLFYNTLSGEKKLQDQFCPEFITEHQGQGGWEISGEGAFQGKHL